MKRQIIALGRAGWSARRIERETGVRRETVSAYLKEAGVAVRPRHGRAKPASPFPGVLPDPKPDNATVADAAKPASPGKPAQKSDRSGEPTSPPLAIPDERLRAFIDEYLIPILLRRYLEETDDDEEP
jgi:hypothetical protein